MNISVTQPRPAIGNQVASIAQLIQRINESPDLEDTVDISRIRFVYPLFSLALSCIKYQGEYLGKRIIYNRSNNIDCSNYFDAIHFPDGLTAGGTEGFNLNYYHNRSYLPIIRFPALNDRASSEIRDIILSEILSKIRERLNLNMEYVNAIFYLISELTDNIVEHSEQSSGFINAQFYPTSGHMDITIIDNGMTILGTYVQKRVMEIDNDIRAITEAVNGRSTKDRADERGYGLITSRNMITQGLGGRFMLYSGNGLLLDNNLISLPSRWNGTILALKIPYNIPNFSYIAYV